MNTEIEELKERIELINKRLIDAHTSIIIIECLLKASDTFDQFKIYFNKTNEKE